MEFKEQLKKYQQIVNNELEKYIKKESCYEKQLNNAVEYSFMTGGKRLRAILVIATYELFKEDYRKCLPYSAAIEMIHNFSLVHDDLPEIDNDDFRHGKPTTHKAYNHPTALLAGDALFNYAYIVISEDMKKSVHEENLQDIKNKTRILNEFGKAIDRMIAGEYLDTEAEGKDISIDLLKYIHHNKTAELLKISVRMGAILADASEEDIEKLSNYAEKIGLAFQVKDDILSEEGNQEIMGKPVGNDKEHHKCTYVSHYGLEKAKEELDKIIDSALDDLEPYGEKAEFLRELTLYIKNRNK